MNKELEEMVQEQIVERGIKDENIIKTFYSVDRKNFVTEDCIKDSYKDTPLPLFEGQTISQPYIVALMTQLLEPQKKDAVLEVGTGSGYQAAILSHLVKKVKTTEINSSLSEFAQKNLEKENIQNVEVLSVDAGEFPQQEQFDKIIITACVSTPLHWERNLKEEGIILAPVYEGFSQNLNKYKKKNGEIILEKKVTAVRFVPLKGKYGIR